MTVTGESRGKWRKILS